MVKFTTQQVRDVMSDANRVRNLAIVAHVDHGKSTLTDSLVFKAGLLSKEKSGTARITDTRKDEKERGVTIKSTGLSLGYEVPARVSGFPEDTPFVINLIDSPGHVDFSSEVTAALRITDGCFVVVDCVEGVCVQTETVMRQALSERVRPTLVLNKLDRAILELKNDPEEAYQSFARTIESVNAVLSQYDDPALGDISVSPTKCNVVFASGLQGWAFSLRDFARIYAAKFGVREERMIERLWGNNFWDEKAKTFRTTPTDADGRPLPRAFCRFVLDPIYKVFGATMDGDAEMLAKITKSLGVELRGDERELKGKHLCQAVMRHWLPAGDALIELAVRHLPSPIEAQKYRTEILYEGPPDDECAIAMRECDANGPLMVYVSKMTPSADSGRFTAFGRVFAGTARTGQKVRVMGPDHVPGKKGDVFNTSIQRTVVWMGGKLESVADVPAGSTVALVGIDHCLKKTGTVSTSEHAHNIKVLKLSVAPVVRVAVECTNAADLPKLVEGMKRLSKSDPCVECHVDETTGEHIVAGAGELHLDVCLNDLEEFAGVPLRRSDPVVSYAETVTQATAEPCLSKSVNKHNRIWVSAEPLSDELAVDLDSGALSALQDKKERARVLVEKYGWEPADAKAVWAVSGANVLVDKTSAVAYLSEVKDSIVSAFTMAAHSAVLTDGTLRGVRFNITDAQLHRDSAHRGPGQVSSMARRSFFAALLSSEARLMEPVYLVDISAPHEALGGIYRVLGARRGVVIQQEDREGSPMLQVKAYLPVAESFGFSDALRSETSGRAFPQCVFDHWSTVASDPLDASSTAGTVVTAARTRKRLPPAVPALSNYLDRL